MIPIKDESFRCENRCFLASKLCAKYIINSVNMIFVCIKLVVVRWFNKAILWIHTELTLVFFQLLRVVNIQISSIQIGFIKPNVSR